jgi:DNA-directed RNA polymerase subunit L
LGRGRTESFYLQDGEDKITFELDSRAKDTATFRINREDHTIGNLLTQYASEREGEKGKEM